MSDSTASGSPVPPATWWATHWKWVVPTAITGCAALTGVLALPQLNRPAPSPTPAAHLRVERVLVTGGRGPADPTVDVLVRNTGEIVSVITGASFEVLAYEEAVICEAGGGVEASASYDIELPVGDPIGETLTVDVTQDVPASGVDRFEVRFAVPESVVSNATYMYQLRVRLAHDGAEEDVGLVVVPVPGLPDEFSVSGEGVVYGGDVGECYGDNAEAYQRVLGWEGTHPPNMPPGP